MTKKNLKETVCSNTLLVYTEDIKDTVKKCRAVTWLSETPVLRRYWVLPPAQKSQ